MATSEFLLLVGMRSLGWFSLELQYQFVFLILLARLGQTEGVLAILLHMVDTTPAKSKAVKRGDLNDT